MRKLTCLALGVLFPLIASSAELPDLIVPAGVGVNIHFVNGHEAELDQIAAAGFKFIRMDFSWQGTEQQKGTYDWAGYDELTANLEKRGLRALYILDYSNPLYEETVTSRNPLNGQEQKDLASPQHPESVAAFARWAAAAAEHYNGRHIVWEIWNEPNISFWKPKADVQQYNTLALATAKAVRAADPKATIIGPGSSEIPWPFLEAFLGSGILEYLDGVSVHPYRDYKKSPETAAEDYQKLRGLIERLAPNAGKKKMPIISSEWGYSTATNGIPLETQAAFIVRQQLSNLLQGVPLSIWYDWKNDGPDPKEWEHNFGTVTTDLKPKPSYLALQTFTRQLAGYRIVKRIETTDPKDFLVLLSDTQGHQKMAAWTMADPHPVSFGLDNLGATSATAVNWKGNSFSVKWGQKTLMLEVSSIPFFLTLQ